MDENGIDLIRVRYCRFVKRNFFIIAIIGLVRIHSIAQSFTDVQICAGESIVITHSVSAQWQAWYVGEFTPDIWTVFRPTQDGCGGPFLECGPTQTYDDGCETCQHTPAAPRWTTFAFSGTSVTFISRLGKGPATVKFRFKAPGSPDWTLVNQTLEILGVPPVLNNVPSTIDETVDSFSEATYTSPTLDVQHVKCNGDQSGLIVVKSLGTPGVYKLRLSNGIQSYDHPPTSTFPIVLDDFFFDVHVGLKAGVYILSIENASTGCPSEEYSIRIKQPPLPLSATATNPNPSRGFNVSCAGVSDGQIQINPSGGIGPYQVSWNGGAFQAGTIISGLGPSSGNFATVRDALGCTFPISGINITEPPVLSFDPPTVSTIPGETVNISCFAGTGSIEINAAGGAGTKTYRLLDEFDVPVPGNDTPDNFNPNPVFDGIPAGTYKVRVTDGNGCGAISSVIVLTQPTDLALTIGTITPPSCLGGNDGKVELVPSGGIPETGGVYQVTISGLEFQPSKNKTGVTVELTDFEAGTYTVNVEDKYCNKDFTATLVIPDNPTSVNFDPIFIEPSCNGLADGSITITGRDGFPINTDEYKFSFDSGPFTAATSNSIVYNTNISAGVYLVGIEDSRGCQQYNNVIVTEPSLIANSFTITENICRGESGGELLATISGATAPYSIEWRDAADLVTLKSETVPNATLLAGLPEADYKLRIKDANGCTNHIADWYTLNTAITDPEFLLLGHSLFDNVSCNGVGDGEVTLLAGGGWSGYTYSKDGGPFVASSSFQNLIPGDYTFSVRDARGCVTTYDRTITEPDVFTSALANLSNVKCFGGTTGAIEMDLAGGTLPYEQSFDGGANFIPGNIISVLPQGNHVILSRDVNGCTASVPILITEPPLLEIDMTRVVHTLCGYAHGEGDVEARGGTLPFAYDWKTSSGVSVRTQPSVTALYPDAYTVTVTDGNLCTSDVLVLVNNTDGPNITNTIVTDAICSYSNEGAIDLTISGGQLPYQYNWSNGEILEDVATLSQGNYLVEVRDGNDCRFYKNIHVGAPAKLDAEVLLVIEPTCFDFTDGALEVTALGGNGGYTYLWNTGSAVSRIENVKAGSYSVDILDQKGCEETKEFLLANPEKFTVDLGPDRVICVGQTHEADGGAAATYQWSSNLGYSANTRVVTLSEPTTYQLSVMNEAGCIAEDELLLETSLDLLRADFVMATEGHAKDTIVVLDISWPLPERIEWTFDKAAKVIYNGQDRAEMIYETRGDYALTLTTALAECRATYTQSITILDERPAGTGGRASADNSLIQRFEIYPNPNDGKFYAEVELDTEMPVRVNMVDMSSNRNILSEQLSGQSKYVIEVNVDVGAGVYAFTIQVGKEIRSKRIIISK